MSPTPALETGGGISLSKKVRKRRAVLAIVSKHRSFCFKAPSSCRVSREDLCGAEQRISTICSRLISPIRRPWYAAPRPLSLWADARL